ncbi:DnaJ domain-containing protein [Tamlana haliotis]|uniref:DnaJ domain-containing protein n=1 Tax=Pseudotamlana haliotis TaxID=2614804 RepID=A0A6N6MFQ3_9FLAO|nr:TerB family tellurite resistance protein [Tamlana haliotis]KAB1066879.1 DnaJ domain-containing protein [Tamlana haliotis]
MSYSKWIGGAIGWSLGGPIGAIIGIAIGSIIDSMAKSGGSPFSAERETYNQSDPRQHQRTQSGDFEVSLLILASSVIKADGKLDQRELDFVRQQFVGMYGKDRANHAFKLFKNINKQQVSIRPVCLQIRQMMEHASRLQLIHFLFGIAKADGFVTESEVNQIHKIAGYLGVSARDYESIKAMFYSDSDASYKILEIEKSASVDEIKKAYRKMAKKYHPDKVIHLGPAHQKGAEEKFRQVQKAYEQIQKERGF